jgi:hypothetical protein
MREEGLVTFRRESQTIWYRVADPRIEKLFAALYDLFCSKNRRSAAASSEEVSLATSVAFSSKAAKGNLELITDITIILAGP